MDDLTRLTSKSWTQFLWVTQKFSTFTTCVRRPEWAGYTDCRQPNNLSKLRVEQGFQLKQFQADLRCSL
jgi:hypothetical protein